MAAVFNRKEGFMIRLVKKHPVISFFALSYLINWFGIAGNIAGIIPPLGEWPLVYENHQVAVMRIRRTLLSWAPNFAAMIVVGLTEGRKGIQNLLKQFFRWKVGLRWWLVTLILPVILAVLSIGAVKLSGGEMIGAEGKDFTHIFFLRFMFSLTTGSIGEEAGWRGFALVRLQKHMGALKASLLIGLVWAFWHTPMWVIRGLSYDYIFNFFLACIGLSIFYSWIYNQSQGSLLLVALAHNLTNALDRTLSRSYGAVVTENEFLSWYAVWVVILAVILILTTKGQLGERQTV